MIRLNEKNINTNEAFSEKFEGLLGVSDIERFELLASKFTGGVYVDVGCFDSIMPIILSERFPGSTIHALDFAEGVINFLKPRFPKVNYQIATVEELPFEDESVDYVVAGEIIEHQEDPQKFVNECLRILKPGGWLAISTPHIEAEKPSKIGGEWHLWSFDEQDLTTLFKSPEITTLQEGHHLAWIVWQQK